MSVLKRANNYMLSRCITPKSPENYSRSVKLKAGVSLVKGGPLEKATAVVALVTPPRNVVGTIAIDALLTFAATKRIGFRKAILLDVIYSSPSLFLQYKALNKKTVPPVPTTSAMVEINTGDVVSDIGEVVNTIDLKDIFNINLDEIPLEATHIGIDIIDGGHYFNGIFYFTDSDYIMDLNKGTLEPS